MPDEPLGVTFRETMSGGFALGETDPEAGRRRGEAAGTVLSLHATVTIRDVKRFVADPTHAGTLSGHVDFPPLGRSVVGMVGVFRLFSPGDAPGLRLMVYEVGFQSGSQEYYLAGQKRVRNEPGMDMWKDTTTLFTRLHRGPDATGPVTGAGVLSLEPLELMKMLSTLRTIGAGSATDQITALGEFGRFFAGSLWDTYVKQRPA